MADDQAYTKSAQYYDLIYQSKSTEMYDNTIKDFHQMSQDILGRDATSVVDVGCGTGTHAIRLAQQGIDVLGVDQSAEQLAVARSKADELGLDITYVEADMRDIPVTGRQYDAAAAFFSGFCYLHDDDSVLQFLVQMDRLITHDGFVYFEFWNSLAIDPDNVGVFETEKDGINLIRTNTVEFDITTGIVTMPMRHIVWKEDEVIDEFTEVHKLRTYTIPQLTAIIEQSTWQISEVFSGFYNVGPDDRQPSINDFRYYALLTR